MDVSTTLISVEPIIKQTSRHADADATHLNVTRDIVPALRKRRYYEVEKSATQTTSSSFQHHSGQV